jgi:hypothetical protein
MEVVEVARVAETKGIRAFRGSRDNARRMSVAAPEALTVLLSGPR